MNKIELNRIQVEVPSKDEMPKLGVRRWHRTQQSVDRELKKRLRRINRLFEDGKQ